MSFLLIMMEEKKKRNREEKIHFAVVGTRGCVACAFGKIARFELDIRALIRERKRDDRGEGNIRNIWACAYDRV